MEAGNRGASFIDGPVLGSLNEAKEGKLWVLAGADPETLDRVKPVLNSISQAVYHVGAIGRGTQMKLCSNLVGAGLVAALAEGMALLDAVGLDASQYMQIVQETNLPTRLWIGKATQMANRDFSPRFSLDNMAKDVRLALTMATQHGLDLRQGEASHASLRRGAVVAGGDRDMAAIFEAARQRTT